MVPDYSKSESEVGIADRDPRTLGSIKFVEQPNWRSSAL
jgi:hypothetical protein